MVVSTSERTGLRASQEDVVVPFRQGAAVYDGHGGHDVSRLLGTASKTIASSTKDPISMLEDVQETILQRNMRGGSTVTIAIVHPQSSTVDVVWCGDGSCFCINDTGLAVGNIVETDLAEQRLANRHTPTRKSGELVNYPHSLPGTLQERPVTSRVPDYISRMVQNRQDLVEFVRDNVVENDDERESCLKEIVLYKMYNGPDKMTRCEMDKERCWVRPHGRSKTEARAVVGFIEPTRSIGDVLYNVSPIPYPTKNVWSYGPGTLGVVVTCDGFYSNHAFNDPSDLAQFLLNPSATWSRKSQVDLAQRKVLDWIEAHPRRTEKYGIAAKQRWVREVESCADFVKQFLDIDPTCNIKTNPKLVVQLATATAILKQSLDNCSIAWIPIEPVS